MGIHDSGQGRAEVYPGRAQLLKEPGLSPTQAVKLMPKPTNLINWAVPG